MKRVRHNYRGEYVVYKREYLALSGGSKVPDKLPETQSWFFMPFILNPFEDVQVQIDESILQLLEQPIIQYGLTISLNQMLIDYYNSKNINMNTRLNLVQHGFRFDDDHSLHLPGDVQDRLLDDAGLHGYVSQLVSTLVEDKRYHGKQILMKPR